MKTNSYDYFINEQKEYFDKNIKPNFKGEWEDPIWYGGTIGSGWLLSRSGKTHFNFENMGKIKGLNKSIIKKEFQIFIKSVLILSYRKSNSNASPQKLYAEFLILKRWYSALYNKDPRKTHPSYLTTLILNKSFEALTENNDKKGFSDYATTYIRLQTILNHYNFTKKPLEFSNNYININRFNRTPKALKTKSLLDKLVIDEDELDDSKLISIRTFINIVSLINLCQSTGEKIALNLLLMLIVTGLRSTEIFLLKVDALIKHPILDPITKKHLTLDGVKQFTLGIQYYGAKGAGQRIHWIDPLSARLVEQIFKSVLELTKDYRENILYIRSKGFCNLLPKSLDDTLTEYVEVDELIGSVFGVKDKTRGRAGQRDVVVKTLKNVPLYKEIKDGKEIKKYYLKKDIDSFIKSLTKSDSENLFHHIFNYEGEKIKIPFEDLLFIHEYRSINLERSFINKTNIIPFNALVINGFLGNTLNTSVFKKYKLFEDSQEYSKITTHIPRHNINTFLALSGLAEHLQAMLMGRIDIKQNQYYQHLALKQSRIVSSISKKHELSSYEEEIEVRPINPLESIQNDGLMFFSDKLDIENNLKMNLQTFDSKNEVAKYIKSSFFDEYFQDISKSFNEIVKKDISEAESLLLCHAYLHPLPFGACTRAISTHECPKRIACQSGEKCGNFVLTGRIGELDALTQLIIKLSKEYKSLKEIIKIDETYSEMFEVLEQKMIFLKNLKEKALGRLNHLTPFPVFPYNEQLNKLPHTLSELFAIEQKKIETKES
ncbi:hypothetical protein [Acinetobacter sp. TUM15071]|uniref:hypothetical protein n=1 Tax=Acinetobacter sp. TUM15071 TaxID=2609135 RepID=UPI00124E4D8E|nr:hypothetical protein [Acinetobacter sp. TUM15071]